MHERVKSNSSKNIKYLYLCRTDKNYDYFLKSNIPVINSIVGSKNITQ